MVVKGSLVAPSLFVVPLARESATMRLTSDAFIRKKRVLSNDELTVENNALQRKLRQQDRLIASLQRDLDRSPEVKSELSLTVPSSEQPTPASAIQNREHAILATDFEVLGMPSVPLSPIVTDPTTVSASRPPITHYLSLLPHSEPSSRRLSRGSLPGSPRIPRLSNPSSASYLVPSRAPS